MRRIEIIIKDQGKVIERHFGDYNTADIAQWSLRSREAPQAPDVEELITAIPNSGLLVKRMLARRYSVVIKSDEVIREGPATIESFVLPDETIEINFL